MNYKWKKMGEIGRFCKKIVRYFLYNTPEKYIIN